MENIKKLQKKLQRIEKLLEKVREHSPPFTRIQAILIERQKKQDYYAQAKGEILAEIESCNSKEGDVMCVSCNCWKHTRAMCS